MRNLIPTCFILLIVAQSTGCAKLSSSSLNSESIQEQVLQDKANEGVAGVAPIVRAQSSILALPPAMRLSTSASTSAHTSFDTPEARSSRSEARHRRALIFAQAQKDVVAKYQQQKQASLSSNSVSQSQVIHLSAIETETASDSLPVTVSISPTGSEIPPASSETSSWHSIGRRTPIFITMLVIALGSLTWPFARGSRPAVNQCLLDPCQRQFEHALPVMSAQEEPVAISAVPGPLEPQSHDAEPIEAQQKVLSSLAQSSQPIAPIEPSELPMEWSLDMATWESHAFGGLTDNFHELLFAQEVAFASEAPAIDETSSPPHTAPTKVIAKIPRRIWPSVQTIKLNPQAKPFSKVDPLSLPYYAKANAIAKVRQVLPTALVKVDQPCGLPARAAHHRSISLNNREIGLPRTIVGVVVLFPQDENGEPTRHVMMVESYELNEHSQLNATVVRVA